MHTHTCAHTWQSACSEANMTLSTNLRSAMNLPWLANLFPLWPHHRSQWLSIPQSCRWNWQSLKPVWFPLLGLLENFTSGSHHAALKILQDISLTDFLIWNSLQKYRPYPRLNPQLSAFLSSHFPSKVLLLESQHITLLLKKLCRGFSSPWQSSDYCQALCSCTSISRILTVTTHLAFFPWPNLAQGLESSNSRPPFFPPACLHCLSADLCWTYFL